MTHDNKVDKLTEIALETYRNMFNDGLSDGDILEMDPAEYEGDASAFYEALSFKIGLYDDDVIYPDSEEGGETVGETIDRMAEHWDGETGSASPFESYMSGEYDDDISPTAEEEEASLNEGETFDAFDSRSGLSDLDDDLEDLGGIPGLEGFDDDEFGDLGDLPGLEDLDSFM